MDSVKVCGGQLGLLRKTILYVHFAAAFYVVFLVGELLHVRMMRCVVLPLYLIACIRTFCQQDGGVIVYQGKCLRDFRGPWMKFWGKLFDVVFLVLHLALVGFLLKYSDSNDSTKDMLLMLFMIAHLVVHCWLCFRNFVI